MRFHDAARDREAEARTRRMQSVLRRAGLFAAESDVEDPGEVFLRQAAALVTDDQLYRAAGGRGAHDNLTTVQGVPDAVRDEVGERAGQLRRTADHRRWRIDRA